MTNLQLREFYINIKPGDYVRCVDNYQTKIKLNEVKMVTERFNLNGKYYLTIQGFNVIKYYLNRFRPIMNCPEYLRISKISQQKQSL